MEVHIISEAGKQPPIDLAKLEEEKREAKYKKFE